MQHTYLLSEVQGKIWMPLIVNVKLKSTDSDQVSNCMVGLKSSGAAAVVLIISTSKWAKISAFGLIQRQK